MANIGYPATLNEDRKSINVSFPINVAVKYPPDFEVGTALAEVSIGKVVVWSGIVRFASINATIMRARDDDAAANEAILSWMSKW